MPCRPSAASAGRPSLPIPELRMNAPGAARRTAVLSDMGAPRDRLLSLSTIGDGSVDVDPRDDTGPMVAEHAPAARRQPAPRCARALSPVIGRRPALTRAGTPPRTG